MPGQDPGDRIIEEAFSMTQTGRLAGRIALVTGASRGIGAAIARRYAA